MSSKSPQFMIFKRRSLHKLFSGLFIDPPPQTGGEIDDDWELIEVSDDQESSDEGEDSKSVDFPDHMPFPSLQLPVPVKFKILSKADVRRLVEDKITLLCSVVPLSRAVAILLLHHFKWDVDRAQDEWLQREKKVRDAVGLYESPMVATSDALERACRICDKKFPREMMLPVSCDHLCHSCLEEHISKAIKDGPRCLSLRCPVPSCEAAVGPDMVELVSSEDDMAKFENHLLRSFLDSCEEAKWCPAQDCDCALLYYGGGDSANNVTCRCLYRFCWKCSNEAHSPVECHIAESWMLETSVQSENWMLTNVTRCPNCKYSIDEPPYSRTYGTLACFERCIGCNYQFCWECGGAESSHLVIADLGEYHCQLDKSSRPDGFRPDDEIKRTEAKLSLERYDVYYRQWTDTETSRKDALTDLKLLQVVQLRKVCDILVIPAKEMDFLVQAHLQIVECWQQLKWAYVYVYFLSDEELRKMPLLEFMQEQAEGLVKSLHKHIEDLKSSLLLGEIVLPKDLTDARSRLVDLTRVTRAHFDKMAMALRDGLPEVVFIPEPPTKQMARLRILEDDTTAKNSSSAPMLEG